jgi:hypothetical protein
MAAKLIVDIGDNSMIGLSLNKYRRNNMTNNDTFKITYYAKKHGKHITRNAKWTDKCKEFISQKGIACMVYLDLDADGYRTATGKWSIK